MMSEFEYEQKLMECILYKRHKVMEDVARMLATYHANCETLISEYRAEHQTIIKMLDSDASNKKKLDFVKSFADDWRPKQRKEHEDECF